MSRVRTLIVNHLWWVVLLAAAVLFGAHTFGLRRIVVDNTSLVLLVVILVSPFVAAIKKVKIGEFEAEIEPEEVRRIAEEVQRSLPNAPTDAAVASRVVAVGSAIKSLAETDPILALAKLRIEVESRLRRLAAGLSPSEANPRNRSLFRLIQTLASVEIIDKSFAAALRDVISICNRALHGEDIRRVDAKQIVDTGSELIEALDQLESDHTPDPIERTVIAPAERDAYQEGKYRVTTVVPLVDDPERRVYLFTQPQLGSFLEGYSEYAEFLVSVERVH